MEITEKSIIDDFGHFREVVTQLRERGFRIAIDDAGAGYSGLQTMVEIEPDFIKLDISLIRGLDTSIVKQKLIRTLRDFCNDAGITLIAEGIETEEQLAALKELQIPFGQGFLFAYPGSPYPLQDRIEPRRRARGGDRPRSRRRIAGERDVTADVAARAANGILTSPALARTWYNRAP